MRPSDLLKEALAENPGVELAVKKDLAYQVAYRIEEARLTRGITQKELAERARTSQSNIARAENGKTLPGLSFLKKLAEDGFGSYLIPPGFGFVEERRLVPARSLLVSSEQVPITITARYSGYQGASASQVAGSVKTSAMVFA